MVSLGAVAYYKGKEAGNFTANLHPVTGTHPDTDTEKFWKANPEAWQQTLVNRRYAGDVIDDFVQWVEKLPGTPVAVCWPSGFDFTFVYWYCHRFTGDCPFVRNSIDIRSYAAGKLGKSYSKISKRDLFKLSQVPRRPHTHVAVEDAREQGELFQALLSYESSTGK
jgi:hypothetical protein